MSVQTQIDRISRAVSAALAAIADKGVTVPDGSNSDSLAALIESIEAGGGGGAGNIATGSITNSVGYDTVALDVMTIDEWVTNYGAFPTTLYAAYFDENHGEITSGYFPLYCASCVVDGNAQICYATVYSGTKISNAKKTNLIAQANKNVNSIQLISPSSTYNFKTGRTYRWVIIW